jgi:hypothetical protein
MIRDAINHETFSIYEVIGERYEVDYEPCFCWEEDWQEEDQKEEEIQDNHEPNQEGTRDALDTPEEQSDDRSQEAKENHYREDTDRREEEDLTIHETSDDNSPKTEENYSEATTSNPQAPSDGDATDLHNSDGNPADYAIQSDAEISDPRNRDFVGHFEIQNQRGTHPNMAWIQKHTENQKPTRFEITVPDRIYEPEPVKNKVPIPHDNGNEITRYISNPNTRKHPSDVPNRNENPEPIGNPLEYRKHHVIESSTPTTFILGRDDRTNRGTSNDPSRPGDTNRTLEEQWMHPRQANEGREPPADSVELPNLGQRSQQGGIQNLDTDRSNTEGSMHGLKEDPCDEDHKGDQSIKPKE